MPFAELKYYPLDSPNNPISIPKKQQNLYMLEYLKGLNAQYVVEEPMYFDRDYLSEYSSFYGISANPYSNHCRRLHFFSIEVNQEFLGQALTGDLEANQKIKNAYLGFCVLRPLKNTPFGRTVLKWYEESNEAKPRVRTPVREYKAHLIGLELTVLGLPWQQQDTGVSACATVSLLDNTTLIRLL